MTAALAAAETHNADRTIVDALRAPYQPLHEALRRSLADLLTQAVTRVVRTSTTDVDRRASERRPVNIACRLSVPGGGVHAARVSNQSDGGVEVADAPSLPVGTRAILEIEGIAEAVSVVVRSDAGGTLHLAFKRGMQHAA